MRIANTNSYGSGYRIGYIKAIKEFADKIDYLVAINNGVPNRAYRKISKDIKNLVEEMAGDDNA